MMINKTEHCVSCCANPLH